MPTPDQPPAHFQPAAPERNARVTHVETFRKPDGSWGVRPTAYGPGKSDPRLAVKITVTPIQKRVNKITNQHRRMV